MPKTKSAERRVRSSTRRQIRNLRVKRNLKLLQKKYALLLKEGKKDEAAALYRELSSALDKAAKTSVVHRATASRTRSRLALALGKLK